MSDLISRQDAIDATHKIVSTNPEDFYAHDKFIKFIDNPETKSYGRWEWSNGYNTALVSMRIELDKMPSAQSEIIHCRDCKHASPNGKYGCKAYHFKQYEVHEMYADDFCSKGERRTE